MTPSERRRRFISNVRAQARRRGVAADEGATRLLGTLAELREQLSQTLAGAPSDFDAYRIPEMLGEMDRQIEAWRLRAVGEVERGIEAAWALGPEIVNGPLAAAEVHIATTILPRSLLEELSSYAAKGMTDLAPTIKKRVEGTIRSAVLGGQSPHEAMQTIQASLSGKAGPFRFVNFRAETVYRTEVGRVHSMAGHRRLVDAAEIIPGLGKEWWWSKVSRTTHAAAQGQKRAADEPFSIGGEDLMYPRDPNASAENTINCGCESLPFKADW